jgi:hypothetical protein
VDASLLYARLEALYCPAPDYRNLRDEIPESGFDRNNVRIVVVDVDTIQAIYEGVQLRQHILLDTSDQAGR